MVRAAAVIIGDEILSGKVRDVNTPLLIDLLKEQGIELWRASFIGDDLQDIAREVRFCADRCDAVITSGGIGPTHDDRTLQGVALAYGVPMVRHPELEQLIRSHWQDRVNDAALRMADGPRGSRLVACEDGLFPIVIFRNIYLLPGIPELFAAKLTTLSKQLSSRKTRRKSLRSIYLGCDESGIAVHLAQVESQCPGVKIGSYPRLDAADFRLWITVEGFEQTQVELAAARLLDLLPTEHVIRVESEDDSNSLFV